MSPFYARQSCIRWRPLCAVIAKFHDDGATNKHFRAVINQSDPPGAQARCRPPGSRLIAAAGFTYLATTLYSLREAFAGDADVFTPGSGALLRIISPTLRSVATSTARSLPL